MKRGHEWREPSDEQLKLEQRLAAILALLIKVGSLTDNTHFSIEVGDQPIDDIAVLLKRAHTLGITHGQEMIGVQESVSSIATSFVDRARAIVSGIVDRVRDLIASALSGDNRDASLSDSDVAEEVIARVRDYLPDEVAVTEIHAQVEDGAMSALRSGGTKQVRWIANPDACEKCAGNAAAGAIDIGDTFPSGDQRPPLHPRCKCNVVPVEEA